MEWMPHLSNLRSSTNWDHIPVVNDLAHSHLGIGDVRDVGSQLTGRGRSAAQHAGDALAVGDGGEVAETADGAAGHTDGLPPTHCRQMQACMIQIVCMYAIVAHQEISESGQVTLGSLCFSFRQSSGSWIQPNDLIEGTLTHQELQSRRDRSASTPSQQRQLRGERVRTASCHRITNRNEADDIQ